MVFLSKIKLCVHVLRKKGCVCVFREIVFWNSFPPMLWGRQWSEGRSSFACHEINAEQRLEIEPFIFVLPEGSSLFSLCLLFVDYRQAKTLHLGQFDSSYQRISQYCWLTSKKLHSLWVCFTFVILPIRVRAVNEGAFLFFFFFSSRRAVLSSGKENGRVCVETKVMWLSGKS